MGLFSYEKCFLNKDEADELFEWCDKQVLKLYPFRGKSLKRSPKLEWGVDDSVGTYRWGQERSSHDWISFPFPKTLENIRQKLGDPEINHCILIGYKHGTENHIPWHSDKQEGTTGSGAKDILAGTNIYNVTVCNRTRVFQLAYPENIMESKTGHGEASRYEFNEALEHGSMIMLTAEGNQKLKHRVPKESNWSGHRYSIVFRKIKSKKDQDAKKRKRSES